MRSARPEDSKDILRIYEQSLSGLDDEGIEWYMSLLKARTRDSIFLVALVDRKVVGFIQAYHNGNKGYVEALAVDPRYRNMGIGSALLSEVERRLKRRGVKMVRLNVKYNNLKALAFYLRRGYIVDGVTLLLRVRVRELKLPPVENLMVKVLSQKEREALYKDIEAMPSTWWSSITEKADSKIYKYYKSEISLAVYSDDKFCGIAEFQPEEITVIDHLAVSYRAPSCSLRALLRGILLYSREKGIEEIVIPIDSTKKALLKTLIDEGFKIEGVEYRLSKRLFT